MDVATVKLLALYNEKTNEEMNALISRLSPGQWTQAFPAYFPSLFKICNHLYLADFIWLKRFSRHRSFQYIQDGVFGRDLNFKMDAFETPQDYLTQRKHLDSLIQKFAEELKEGDLGSSLVYKDSKGQEYQKNLGGLILHMFNHQTHHRGMISLYLEMLGVENDYSNLAYRI